MKKKPHIIEKLLFELQVISGGKFEEDLSEKNLLRIKEIGEIILSEKLLDSHPEKDFYIQIMMKNNVPREIINLI